MSNPSEDSSKQNLSRRRSPRSVVSVAVIIAVMLAAAIALTVRRSSPTQPAAAGTVASTAVAAAPPASSGPVDVAIMDFAFAPAAVTVKAGTTVTWTNHDSEAHTVRTTKSTTVKSDVLATGATFSFTFTTPGAYAYHCSIHPEMHGTVVVTG